MNEVYTYEDIGAREASDARGGGGGCLYEVVVSGGVLSGMSL